MKKYKIGDRVRVVDAYPIPNVSVSAEGSLYTSGIVIESSLYRGKTGTVTDTDWRDDISDESRGGELITWVGYIVHFDDSDEGFGFVDAELERVTPDRTRTVEPFVANCSAVEAVNGVNWDLPTYTPDMGDSPALSIVTNGLGEMFVVEGEAILMKWDAGDKMGATKAAAWLVNWCVELSKWPAAEMYGSIGEAAEISDILSELFD